MISHRRFLIGLVLLVPLGLGWGMKRAASWRPVAMGKVALQNEGGEQLTVSGRCVLSTRFAKGRTFCTLFDTSSGREQSTRFFGERVIGTGLSGNSLWSFDGDEVSHSGHVEIEGTNQRFSFPRPESTTPQVVALRFLPRENRAIFLYDGHIYSWNVMTSRLERDIRYQDPTLIARAALSRDARTFVAFDVKGFKIGDARTGKILKKVAFQGFDFFETLYFSPYGQYAFCDSPDWMRVIDTTRGKSLWTFENTGDYGSWVVSDDERTVLIHKNKSWDVHDMKTGNVRYHLPYVPDTSVAALSPDGATLYCIAKGVLYRQRAR